MESSWANMMLSHDLLDAIKFGAEAQQDWVVPIPEQDLRDMASYLTDRVNKPELTYQDYHRKRYEAVKSDT